MFFSLNKGLTIAISLLSRVILRDQNPTQQNLSRSVVYLGRRYSTTNPSNAKKQNDDPKGPDDTKEKQGMSKMDIADVGCSFLCLFIIVLCGIDKLREKT